MEVQGVELIIAALAVLVAIGSQAQVAYFRRANINRSIEGGQDNRLRSIELQQMETAASIKAVEAKLTDMDRHYTEMRRALDNVLLALPPKE